MFRFRRRKSKKVKIITSDMHLSAGLYLDGSINPHEDFYYDSEFIELINFFSTGNYGDGCEVEIILNGDVFDFLNVPYEGEFTDAITEEIALYKLEKIFDGHPEVTEALQEFVQNPGKSLIYNIGNHDPEFFFPSVRKAFCEKIGGKDCPPEKVRVHVETEFLEFDGIEVHHGNQFEAVHYMNYKKPFITSFVSKPILDIPWGTVYVLKIINRLKWERPYVDKIKPAKMFMLWGLISDPIFTIKFFLLSAFYFLHTRFIYNPRRRATIKNTLKIIKQEITPFHGLEDEAREIMDNKKEVQTVIFGHTHGPMQQNYRDGKTYINTGTWTRVTNLDLRHFGQGIRLTFAFIEYDSNNKPSATLEEWHGMHSPHKLFNG